ncbi:helix-turn-helix domain-containing protein [Sphingomonas sp. LR55]
MPITLPALRERRQDIALLARHFLDHAAMQGLPRRQLGSDALTELGAHDWPGNVRELENLMRRLAVLARDEVIGAEAIRAMIGTQAASGEAVEIEIGQAVRAMIDRIAREDPASLDDGTLYDRVIGEVERPLIEAMLARHGQNQLRAARALGINRNTLRKRLDTLGIHIDSGVDAQRGDEAERR